MRYVKNRQKWLKAKENKRQKNETQNNLDIGIIQKIIFKITMINM